MKRLLPLLLAGLLGLASCGSTPTTTTPAASDEDTTLAPLASREFLFSKGQTRALAQGAGLSALDTAELGDRLRVVLSVARIQSGRNIGKKKATARIIWGKSGVQLDGHVTLTLGKPDTLRALTALDSDMNMLVRAPEYQVTRIRSTAAVAEAGYLCARLAFTFTAPGMTFNTAPLETCETPQQSTQATADALVRYSSDLDYTYESIGVAEFVPVTVSAIPNNMPTANDMRPIMGMNPAAPIVEETLDDFFAPLLTDANGRDTGYGRLKRQFLIYFNNAKVFRGKIKEGREAIWIIGSNLNGASGLRVFRFGNDTDGPDGAYVNATYGSYGGIMSNEVVVNNVPSGAEVLATGDESQRDICPAVGSSYRGSSFSAMELVSETTNTDGTRRMVFTAGSHVDNDLNMIFNYAVHINEPDTQKALYGFVCYTPHPIGLDSVTIYADFFTNPYRGTVTAGWVYLKDMTPDTTYTGTYRIESRSECGAGSGTMTGSGGLLVDDVSEDGYGGGTMQADLTTGPVDGSTAGVNTALVYRIVFQRGGQTRTVEDYTCWYTY